MPKATITLTDGTLVTIEGNPEEISRILRLYSGREEEQAKGRPAGETLSETEAVAESQSHRRVSMVWWLSPVLLVVLILGWVWLYGKLNSVLTGVENLNQEVARQAASAATQSAMPRWAPPLQISTPMPAADCSTTKSCTYRDMTLCFVQISDESGWRTANSISMKETAEKLGIKQLIFSEGAARRENQVSAVRACIEYKADVIALAPVMEDGWEAVLTEVKNAGIPVILVDRSVNADPSLYATHIGSDMALEGQRAAIEFNKHFPNGGSILEISGTIGWGVAINRGKGFRDQLNSNINILDSQTANFTRAEAIPVMQAFLKKYKAGTDFQGIFVHNDDMGIGVIEALKEAGVNPGELFIVSIDATREGLQAMLDGWFQADVECSPLLGPQVFELALKLMNGEPVDREVPTNESVYYPEDAPKLLDHSRY